MRLAQLKAQLALTQINAFSVGGRAATLTANSNTSTPYLPATPPSPTAAAINLLNLLKIANTMSHPLYNPYSSGNQRSTQGQYGHPSVQAERDPQRVSPLLGPGSSISPSGVSSGTPANSGGMFPSLVPHSMNYRPEHGRPAIDEDIEKSIDMHISRAREEVRLLGTPMHPPIGHGAYLASTQRDKLLSSQGSGKTSYPMSANSASLGHMARHSKVESGSGSLDWLSDFKRSTADGPSNFYSSPASSSYAGSGDCRFNPSSERERDMSSIPGLGDYDYQVPDQPAAPESSRPKYTSESAADILVRFGLEKEDLEHLITYPEDQITPTSLPFILRQIRIQKAKRATTAVQSQPEPPPTRHVSGMDSFSSSGEAGMHKEEMSSSILQPSKVIDYGHIGKYTGAVGDEIGSRANSGGMKDNCDSGSHSRDPLKKNTSRDQASSVTSLSSSYSSMLSSVAPSSTDPTKRLQTHQNQTPQEILSSFPLPKKDTDMRILKSEASKPIPLKEPEANRHLNSFRAVHPSRPGLVVIGNNDSSDIMGQSKTQGKGSTVAEQMKKQQQMQKQPMQQQKQPMQQTQKRQKQQVQHQQQVQPAQKQQPQQQQQQLTISHSQMGQTLWPPVFSATKPIPPVSTASQIPSITNVRRRPVFTPSDHHRTIIIPSGPPQLIPMNFVHTTLPPSNIQLPAKVAVFKGLPTAAMMHDYAAATPRIFPHTCVLCNKECTQMKVSERLHLSL